MKRVIILVLFVLGSLCTCEETKPKTEGGVHTRLHRSLLERWTNATALSPEKQAKVNQIKARLEQLMEKLLEEEVKLNMLKYKKYALQDRITWFFDPDTRRKVDEVQREINDQERVIHNLLDDVEMEWRNLKPLYGLFSKMFLGEVMNVFTYFIEFLLGLFATLFEMGLISMLIFGPVTGLIVATWTWLGIGFTPFFVTMILFGLDIFWMFKLPFIMIQYNPAIPEFLAVYFSVISVMILFTNIAIRLLFGPEPERAARMKPLVISGRGVRVPIEAQ